MKSKIILCIACVLCITCIALQNICAAATIAEGRGATESAALHDAMRSAIEQELGVRIDSKTYVENYQLVEDKIYSHSEGFITSYEILSKEEFQGIHTVKIRAEVRGEAIQNILGSRLKRRALIDANLEDARIAVLSIDAEGNSLRSVEDAVYQEFSRMGFTHLVELKEAERERWRLSRAEETAIQETMPLAADYFIVVQEEKRGWGTTTQKNLSLRIVDGKGALLYAKMFRGSMKGFLPQEIAKAAARAMMKAAENPEHHIRVIVTREILGTAMEARGKLRGIEGVRQAFLRTSSAGKFTFDVVYDGTASDLAAAIENMGIRVQEIGSEFLRI